jgi:hypothetical protein
MCSGKSTLSKLIGNKFPHIYFKVNSFANKIYEVAYDLFNMKEKDRELLQNIGSRFIEIDQNVWG